MSSTQLEKTAQKSLLTDILKFYIPLSLSFMILMSSHSVINSSLSRTVSPEVSLAAYAVAMSIMNMIATVNPVGRKLLVAQGHDKNSFATCKKVLLRVMYITLVVMTLVVFTPLSKFVFLTIFHYPETLFPEIIAAARYCIALPLIYTLRAYSQGIIIVKKQTQFMTIAVILRIAFMILLAVILPSSNLITGASVGIIIWLSGMAVEAISSYFFSRKLYRELPQVSPESDKRVVVTQRSAFSFLWPLILLSLMMGLAKPLLNSGLARSSNPEEALATYQVAYNFAWIFIALIANALHMVPLVFGETAEKLAYIRKFTLITSVIISFVIGILALTPLGTWVLTHLVGVDSYLALRSKQTLLALMFAPLVIAWQEYLTGVLMQMNNTKALSAAKLCNMFVATALVYGLAINFPLLGATAGAIAIVGGYGIELLVLMYFKKRQCQHQ